MPVKKEGKKSTGAMPRKPTRTMPKKKASAPQRAAQREQRQQGRATARAPRSAVKVSQSRYPGETPLTGEDRPSNRAGAKRGAGSGRKA